MPPARVGACSVRSAVHPDRRQAFPPPEMQPCSASAPALASGRLVIPRPDYISYTARLLLQSSTLLAQVGASAGMDQARRNQSPDASSDASAGPHWQDSLENPPTSHWANVPARDWRYHVAPPAAESDAADSVADRKKKRPANLKAFIRRREDDSASVPPLSRSPLPHLPIEQSRSAPSSQTSFPRSASGPPSMPSSSRTHADQHPSPLRVPRHSSGRNYTTGPPPRNHSDYPTSPQYHYPQTPLDRPSSSSRAEDALRSPLRAARTYPGVPWQDSPNRAGRVQRRPSATFDDDSELHSFAEATSGFDPFSPVRQRPLSQCLHTEYYAPRGPGGAPQPTSYSQPIPQYPFQQAPAYSANRSPGIARSSSAALAEALRAMEEEEAYAMPPDDEELPDYAQSQWEAQSAARRAAARRAAELERQWVESRQRRGSR